MWYLGLVTWLSKGAIKPDDADSFPRTHNVEPHRRGGRSVRLRGNGGYHENKVSTCKSTV